MTKFLKIYLFIIILANIFVWFSFFNYLSIFSSRVAFLSVGQGDAELIINKSGNILIDAGPDASILTALGENLPLFDRTIDLFILTNQDKDHYAGFLKLIEHYQVRAVMLFKPLAVSQIFSQFLSALEKLKVPVLLAASGATVELTPQEKISVLYPFKNFTSKKTNDFSVILDFSSFDWRFLFTSDADSNLEKRLMLFQNLKPYQVLKVAHHGSPTASSLNFLKLIQPLYAVIEVGKNNYGHPSEDVINRLNSLKSQIFRTDLDGNIKFYLKNGHWQVENKYY